MESDTHDALDDFLENIPFPIDREGLLLEAMESPLPRSVRDAIALLPDKEYRSRTEVKHALVGLSPDDDIPKKDTDEHDLEDEAEDTSDPPAELDDSAAEEKGNGDE
jgi:hypothetical protein